MRSPTGREGYPSNPNLQNVAPKGGTATGRYSASASESNLREIPRRKLDLNKYKTAAGAAKALYKYLCEHAAAAAASPDYEVAGTEVIIRKPGEGGPSWANGSWHVMWESGPYGWASAVMAGESMYAEEYGIRRPAEVVGFRSPVWDADVGYSFSIVFRD